RAHAPAPAGRHEVDDEVEERAIRPVPRDASVPGPGDRREAPEGEGAEEDEARPAETARPPPERAAGGHGDGEQREQQDRARVPREWREPAAVRGPDDEHGGEQQAGEDDEELVAHAAPARVVELTEVRHRQTSVITARARRISGKTGSNWTSVSGRRA